MIAYIIYISVIENILPKSYKSNMMRIFNDKRLFNQRCAIAANSYISIIYITYAIKNPSLSLIVLVLLQAAAQRRLRDFT